MNITFMVVTVFLFFFGLIFLGKLIISGYVTYLLSVKFGDEYITSQMKRDTYIIWHCGWLSSDWHCFFSFNNFKQYYKYLCNSNWWYNISAVLLLSVHLCHLSSIFILGRWQSSICWELLHYSCIDCGFSHSKLYYVLLFRVQKIRIKQAKKILFGFYFNYYNCTVLFPIFICKFWKLYGFAISHRTVD